MKIRINNQLIEIANSDNLIIEVESDLNGNPLSTMYEEYARQFCISN